MSEIDRNKRERKLVALVLNDMGVEMDPSDVEDARREVSNLSDEQLHRTLARRLDLDENVQTGELDDALAFVQEPEIISGDANDLGSTPDLSHADDADGPTDAR